MPGIPTLLDNLNRTRVWEKISDGVDGGAKKPHRVHIALATSSHESNFKLKTAHLGHLFKVFEAPRRVLGDDKRIPPGRGKPCTFVHCTPICQEDWLTQLCLVPDIYLLALDTINQTLPAGETPIKPEECLVFEDSVPGVEAGRRAGMRVVWCPHPMLKKEYHGREAEVLAGRTGEAGNVDPHQLGQIGDGWAEYLPTLVDFPYAKYGIAVPPAEMAELPQLKEVADREGVKMVVAASA